MSIPTSPLFPWYIINGNPWRPFSFFSSLLSAWRGGKFGPLSCILFGWEGRLFFHLPQHTHTHTHTSFVFFRSYERKSPTSFLFDLATQVLFPSFFFIFRRAGQKERERRELGDRGIRGTCHFFLLPAFLFLLPARDWGASASRERI